jgi:hypothetical protein
MSLEVRASGLLPYQILAAGLAARYCPWHELVNERPGAVEATHLEMITVDTGVESAVNEDADMV